MAEFSSWRAAGAGAWDDNNFTTSAGADGTPPDAPGGSGVLNPFPFIPVLLLGIAVPLVVTKIIEARTLVCRCGLPLDIWWWN